MANCATVASTHWDKPESLLWDERVWLDPATRAVSVLLPCPGRWRVAWTHIDRPPEGQWAALSIVSGKGESVLTIASDGEEHAMEIDLQDLDPDGWGVDDRESAADAK